jgi:hypothetical protein
VAPVGDRSLIWRITGGIASRGAHRPPRAIRGIQTGLPMAGAAVGPGATAPMISPIENNVHAASASDSALAVQEAGGATSNTARAAVGPSGSAISVGATPTTTSWFYRDQTETAMRVADLARQAHAGRPVTEAADALPLPCPVAELAPARAYRQLDGAPADDPPVTIAEALGALTSSTPAQTTSSGPAKT